MEKDLFKKLPINHQISYIKSHLDILTNAISARMQILPTASTLAATLLVVATFNPQLVPLTCLVKVLLSILLLLVPSSLWLYNYDLKRAQDKTKKYLEKLLGENEYENEGTLNEVVKWFPDIAIYLITAVIITIVFIIWL